MPDYPLFLLVGLIVWVFFAQALLAAAPSLVQNAPLVRKVRFPRETIPASVAAVQLATFLVMLVLVVPVALVVRGIARPGAAAAAADRGAAVLLRARAVAGGGGAARPLPRRRAGAGRRAAAVVLRHADLPAGGGPARASTTAQWLGDLLRVGQPDRAVRRRRCATCSTPAWRPSRRHTGLPGRRRALARSAAGVLLFRRHGARPGGDPVSRAGRGRARARHALVPRAARAQPHAEGAVRAPRPRRRPTPRSTRCDDVNLRVEPGEAVGLVGRNGAGKTSTLRCLAGIVPLDSGRAECGGRVVTAARAGRRLRRRLLRPREHLPQRRAARLRARGDRGARGRDRRASPSWASSSTCR